MNYAISAQFASALLAAAAGYFWFWSCGVRTPDSFPIHVVEPSVRPMDPLDAKYIGYGYSPELADLANGLKVQGVRSAAGAVFAGASAFAQVLSYLPEPLFYYFG